jgi:hypothetical protein
MEPCRSCRESERAACEAIARAEVGRCNSFDDGKEIVMGNRIADLIAARKGKGEALNPVPEMPSPRRYRSRKCGPRPQPILKLQSWELDKLIASRRAGVNQH